MKYKYRFAARQGWTRLEDLVAALASINLIPVSGYDRDEFGPGAYVFWIATDDADASPFPVLNNPVVTGPYQVTRLDSKSFEVL